MKNEKKEIPLPKDIFGTRLNSAGMDISEKQNLENLSMKLEKFKDKRVNAESIYLGRQESSEKKIKVSSISSDIEMGTINYDAPKDIKDCLEKNDLDEWQNISLKKRSEILNQVADSIEKDPYELIFYLINEAGKTIQNAVDEIREGVDFLRYYSEQALKIIEGREPVSYTHLRAHET